MEQWILQFAGRAHASAGTNSLQEEGKIIYVVTENVLRKRARGPIITNPIDDRVWLGFIEHVVYSRAWW